MQSESAMRLAFEALDRLEIAETISSYGLHFDAGEFDEFAELFTDDAEVDVVPAPNFLPVPLRGRAAIVAAMRQRHVQVALTAVRRHVTTNTVISNMTHESAQARSYLTIVSAPHSGPVQLVGTGVYHDELRKDAGRWRIWRRKLRLDALAAEGHGSE